MRPRHAGRNYKVPLLALVAVYLSAIFAGFLAPYDPSTQSRDFAFVPPTRVHWIDRSGSIHVRPFVYNGERLYPIRFFVRGAPYRVAGLFSSDRHLIGVDQPATLFLLGTDGFGRDQLSRLLYGAQISLVCRSARRGACGRVRPRPGWSRGILWKVDRYGHHARR